MARFPLATILAVAMVVSNATASAQQFGRFVPRATERATPAGRAEGRADRGLYPGEANPLRPYGAPASRPAGNRAGWSSSGRAVPPPVEENFAAVPVRRTYFPGMRTGQGANRNVVNPRSLCVPGRMALIAR